MASFQKKATIDYTLQATNGVIPVCYMADPNEQSNIYYPPGRFPEEFQVYMRNRGEIDGAIQITIQAQGALVGYNKLGSFDTSTSFPSGNIPNTGNWDLQIRYFVKPIAGTQTITINVTAQGIGQAEAKPYTTTTVTLHKTGNNFQCD